MESFTTIVSCCIYCLLFPDSANPPPQLFGVSEHTGLTANSGHYTATVRNSKDGNWYRYNDSHVGTTCEPVVTGGAYLLFYRQVKGSLRWAGMEKQMMDQHNNECNFNSTQTEVDSEGFGKRLICSLFVLGLHPDPPC
jgi:hypothetical protein